jgi:NAD(P)-dependent dehydrogenase (short-subunit alcohol dehydrogenase family)
VSGPRWPGRRVWIVGASSGIGAELARELHRRGAVVAVTARRADRLAAMAAGRMVAVPADAGDPAAIDAAADQITDRLGGLDDVIWCAGHWQRTDATSWDREVFARHVEVNLLGLNNVLGAVLPGLVAAGSGRLVVVSSVAGYRGLAGAEAYAATKSAQLTLAESLRAGLAKSGVAVTAVCPGFVRTELTAGNSFPMPFLMDAGPAARIIADGLQRGRPEIAFPWQMALLMKTARVLPVRVWAAVAAGLAARDSAPSG